MMRVTSDLWVSALIRRVQSAGGFAAVLRRGAFEAGAVFIVSRSRLGEMKLYAPAPQAAYPEDGRPQERRFSQVLGQADEDALAARLEREARFDPDLWVVEIEAGGNGEAELFPVTTP
jgi:hypothetical protein